MFIEWLLGIVAGAVGFFSVAIVMFAIAFVISKSFNKKWPYKVAIIFSIIFYVFIIAGMIYRQGE